MGAFESFRDDGWGTYYPEIQRAVWGDFSLVIFTYFCAVLGVILIIVVIGSRGKERWTLVLRLVLCFHTGAVIIVCILGRCWQVSHASVTTDYSMNGPTSIKADIGVTVGLEKVNITLNSNAQMPSITMRIDYNEELSLDHAGQATKDYRRSLDHGLPWPILYVMDYFQVDTGGLRWGRKIGEAGHFTSIILWSALSTWLLSNVLLCIVVMRGLIALSITGLLMIIACVVYHCLQPSHHLVIHFEGGEIRLAYGWSFWLCLSTGILTLVLALLFLMLHWKFPHILYPVYKVKKKVYLNTTQDSAVKSKEPISPLQLDTPITKRRKLQQQQRSNSNGRANPVFDFEELTDEDQFVKHFIKNPNKHEASSSVGTCSSSTLKKPSDTSIVVVAEINEDSRKLDSVPQLRLNNCTPEFVGKEIKFLTPKSEENDERKSPEIKDGESAATNHIHAENVNDNAIGAFKFKSNNQDLEQGDHISNYIQEARCNGDAEISSDNTHSSFILETIKGNNTNESSRENMRDKSNTHLKTSVNSTTHHNGANFDSISITMDDAEDVKAFEITCKQNFDSVQYQPKLPFSRSVKSFQLMTEDENSQPIRTRNTSHKNMNRQISLDSYDSTSSVTMVTEKL